MTTFEKKNIMPPKMQAMLLGGSAALGMLIAKFVAQDQLTIWMIGATCLLLFALLNNGLSFYASNYKSYLMHSIYSFMFIMVGVIAWATVLSGLSVFEAGSYRNIFLIILVANFIFISMIITIKGLLTVLAEKDKKLK